MKSVEWNFTVGTTNALILGPNPNRTSIIFSGDGANKITVSTNPPAAIGDGVTVTSQNATIAVDDSQYGSRIKQPWYAIANNAGALLTVVEGFT